MNGRSLRTAPTTPAQREGGSADALAAAAVVALTLLGFWAMGQQENVLAQGSPLVVGIDPETTGNTCGPSPTDCTLGPLEPCYEVACPSTECTWDGSSTFDGASDYVIDVYIDDPAGSAPAPVEYNTWAFYDQNIVHIADGGTDGKVKMPGADTGGADENFLPDSDGTFMDFWTFVLSMPDPGANTYPLTVRSARLAINDSCAIPPVGGIAQLPPPSDSQARSYTTLAAAVAAAAVALAAGCWYARRRLS
jgi:hypothetical protein